MGKDTPEEETLLGLIERVVYRGDDGRFAVALVRPNGEDLPIKAAGELGDIEDGDQVRLMGHFRNDQRFGRQFKVSVAYPVLPHTEAGLVGYLSSGRIKSIGPKLAERLVAYFSTKTLDIIMSSPERLTEVQGIGLKRSREIRAQVTEQVAHRDAIVFLRGLELHAGHADRIWKKYEARTIGVVRGNPYRLAEEVRGIGFSTADRIGRGLGFDLEHPARAAAGLVHLLAKANDDGHVFLPRGVLLEQAASLLGETAPAAAQLSTLVEENRLLDDGGAIYLNLMHSLEVELAHRLRARTTNHAEQLLPDPALYEDTTGLTLAPAQRAALELAAEAPIMVLTGGPGTGKTTIVRAVIHLFRQLDGEILLAAPTGRAARRLTETTGAHASTLHRLLGYHPIEGFRHDEETPLTAAAVVVDEASMLDQALTIALLRAMPPGARLLLVGDADQLPSVGPGNVLADLLASGVVPSVRLTEIFRQAEASEIVRNAHRILEGQSPQATPKGTESDFYLIPTDTPAKAAELIAEMVAVRIPRRFGLDPVDDIQVLAPMHRGVCGAMQLNELLQTRLNPDGVPVGKGKRRFRVGDKIMQTRNDYQREVFNGDLGRVVGLGSDGVAIRFEERLLVYGIDELDDLVLAYACSVHKSQGSEYPAILLPLLTEHWPMLHRNLLYTAVTRGRRLVVLVGQPRAIHRATNNLDGNIRFTRLAERLRGHP